MTNPVDRTRRTVRVRADICNTCAFQPRSTDPAEREKILEEAGHDPEAMAAARKALEVERHG